MSLFRKLEKAPVHPLRFESTGPGIRLLARGLTVHKIRDEPDSFALATPVLHTGTASATFKIDSVSKYGGLYVQLGVFPADLSLSSSVESTDGKRCALFLNHSIGGLAMVLCDGERSDEEDGIALQPGDTVTARLKFLDATTAHVTLIPKDKDGHPKDLKSLQGVSTEGRTLQDVPECGLRFGAGMAYQGQGVTLLESSVDAGVRTRRTVARINCVSTPD